MVALYASSRIKILWWSIKGRKSRGENDIMMADVLI